MLQLRLFVALMLPQSLLAQPNTPDFLWSVREHSGAVNALAISPDGRRVASAGADHTLKLLGMADGHLVRTFTGHEDVVYAVAFSPDSGQLASGGADQMVLIWDVRNPVPLASLKGHTDRINAVAFAPNGALVASASDDLTIRLWRLPQYDLLRVLEGPKKRIVAVAFSTDGTQVLGASTDGSLWKWNAATGAPVGDPLVVPTNAPAMALWPAAGWAAVSVSATAEVEVFDLRDGSRIGVLTGHSQRPSALALSRGADTILTTSRDATLRFWEAPRGAALLSLTQECDGIVSLCFSPVENLFAGGRANGEVFVARDSSTAPFVLAQPQGQSVLAGTNVTLTVNATGLFPLQYAWRVRGEAVPGGTGATLTLTNIQVPDAGDYQVVVSNPRGSVTSQTATVRVSLFDTVWMKGGHSVIYSVAYSPDGALVASASLDQTVKIWRVADGALLRILAPHLGGAYAVAFSPTADLLATGGEDCTVRLWRVSDGILLRKLVGHTGAVRSVAFSPDGTTLASAGDGKSLKFWRVADGAFLRDANWLFPTVNTVGSLVFSRDGSGLLAKAEVINGLSIVASFQVSDGQQLGHLLSSHGTIHDIALSPSTNMLAVAADDGTVTLWQLPETSPLLTLTNDSGRALCVAFSPDGNTVASASEGGKTRLWRVTDGMLQQAFNGGGNSLAFSPAGDALLVGGARVGAGNLDMWRTSDGALLRAFLLGANPFAVAFSTDGDCLAVGTDTNITLLRVTDGSPLTVLTGHAQKVNGVAFSPDGKTLASGASDKKVKLWRFTDGTLLRTLTGQTESVWPVAFALGSSTVAAQSADDIKLWRMADGALVCNWQNPVAYAYIPGHTMAASPDGSLLAFSANLAGGVTNIVALARPADGTVWRTITNLNVSRLASVAFSPNGRAVAVGLFGGSPVEIRRVADGSLLQTVPSPGKGVWSLDFSQDGRVLAAADCGEYNNSAPGNSYDAGLRFWRVTDGMLLHEVDFWPTMICTAVRSPSPGLLVIALEDSTLIMARDPLPSPIPPAPVLAAGPLQTDRLFRFSVTSLPGLPYRLQFSTDLQNWQYWRTVICEDPVQEFQDSDTPANPRRYYRAVLP